MSYKTYKVTMWNATFNSSLDNLNEDDREAVLIYSKFIASCPDFDNYDGYYIDDYGWPRNPNGDYVDSDDISEADADYVDEAGNWVETSDGYIIARYLGGFDDVMEIIVDNDEDDDEVY